MYINLNRFFISPNAIQFPHVHFDVPIAHQMHHVLRLYPGNEVWVCDNTGWAYRTTLTELNARFGKGEITERVFCANEPACDLTLYVALIKIDRFEWMLQKCTEIGVRRIVPLHTQHTTTSPQTVTASRRQRWRAICREAAEQCQRSFIPEVFDLARLQSVVPEIASFDKAWLCWESPTMAGTPITRIATSEQPRLAVLIGPEGGWHESEIKLLELFGAQSVGLGKRILRTETASVVACFAAMQGY